MTVCQWEVRWDSAVALMEGYGVVYMWILPGGATKWNHVGNYVGTLLILTSIDGLPTSKKSWASVVAPWITDAPTPLCIS